MKNWKNITFITILTAGLSGLTWYIWWRLFRDGIGSSGYFDDEPLQNEDYPMKESPTYAQQPIALKFFKTSEFDSPDAPGSGEQNMRVTTLSMLDVARANAGIAFRINSGYRTLTHNTAVGGQKNSSHMRGYACDISARTLQQRITVVRAARAAGFNRFGIYDTFVHLDNDPKKTKNVAWDKSLRPVKSGGNFAKFPFDPFTV